VTYIALDTETTLIRERASLLGATYIEPDETPDFVILSWHDGASGGALWGESARLRVSDAISRGHHLVFHNFAFDFSVLIKAFPSLRDPLILAVDEGRVHDTMLLEILLNLASGRPRRDGKPITVSDRLDALEARYGVSNRNKDDLSLSKVRLSFGDFLHRQTDLPQEHLAYAIEDARATWKIYQEQLAIAETYRKQTPDGAWDKWGVLTENIQVKGAVALNWLARGGLHVDVPLALERDRKLGEEIDNLKIYLVSYGIARLAPKSKKFSIQQKLLRSRLAAYAVRNGITPEYSDSGLLSLSYDFWAKEIKPHPANTPVPANADEDTQIGVWMRYARSQQMRKRYTSVYSAAPAHYSRYFVLGARTGRTSASMPAAMQIPKRKQGGLRELFIAPPGRVLIEADFVAAELVALAQVQLDLYGASRLADVLNAGEDPHVATAKLIRADYDTLPDTEKKQLRQAAKAVNYGLPGGLGAARFSKYATSSFNFPLTVEEARDLRNLVLEQDTALARYLRDDLHPDLSAALAAKNLCLSVDELVDDFDARIRGGPDRDKPNWICLLRRLRDWSKDPQAVRHRPRYVPPGFNPKTDLYKRPAVSRTGRIAGQSTYTQRANLKFQSLVADAIKLALWSLFKEFRFVDIAPHNTSHDSVLVSVLPADIEKATSALHRCFSSALSATCPSIKCSTDITVLGTNWAGTKKLQQV